MPEVRLINANALQDKIRYTKLRVKSSVMMAGFVEMKAAALREIENAPTIEPEVRHGEWHECWHTDTVCASICTNCEKAATQARVIVGQELMTNVRYPLCPNCGARMDATDTNVGGKGGDDNVSDV